MKYVCQILKDQVELETVMSLRTFTENQIKVSDTEKSQVVTTCPKFDTLGNRDERNMV